MRGFGNVESAARFCRAFDELRQFFRFRTTMSQSVSLEHQRELFLQRFDALQTLMMA
jgi:putative transposase